jgi:hypothetical protein
LAAFPIERYFRVQSSGIEHVPRHGLAIRRPITEGRCRWMPR